MRLKCEKMKKGFKLLIDLQVKKYHNNSSYNKDIGEFVKC